MTKTENTSNDFAIKRLFDLLDNAKEQYGEDHPAFAKKKNGKWNFVTVKEYIDLSNAVSAALLKLGFKKGDKIALVSSNRPEWNIIDMGANQIGCVLVPIYPTISEGEYVYILKHAEVKAIFIESKVILNKLQKALQVANISTIITIDSIDENYKTLDYIYEIGKQNLDLKKIQELKDDVSPFDCATMIYTSGTTGDPKGVMLSHDNFASQLWGLKDIPTPGRLKRALSFLPVCHVYERTLVYFYQYHGACVYFTDNFGTVIDDIKETNSNIICCVPRMLELINKKIIEQGKNFNAPIRTLYFWAIGVAYQYDLYHRSLWYRLKYAIAKPLFFDKWKAALGGDFDLVVSGGAGINPRLSRFFNAIGWPIFEGYGMTETSPVIAVSQRTPNGRQPGTVGPALPGVEIKIDPNNNEVCCRGRLLMMGYYKDPERTKEAIDAEGWMHTGDAGVFDEYRRLRLTGRIKSLFKTAMGKYVNPEVIEGKCTENSNVEYMMVCGENQKFVAAVIVPNYDKFAKVARENGITDFTNKEELCANKQANKLMLQILRKYDHFFGSWEQIKRVVLVPEDWGKQTGFLTPTLKLKRNTIHKYYSEQIRHLFD